MPHHSIWWTPVPNPEQQRAAKAALKMMGPRINIQISVPDAYVEALTRENKPIPEPVIGMALIDTGASDTSIDANVATRLGLPITDTIPLRTPDGESPKNVYATKLSFPGTHLPPLPTYFVTGVVLENQGLIALIGRDFLVGKMLHYDGAISLVTLTW